MQQLRERPYAIRANTAIRREAFKVFSICITQIPTPSASAYNTQIQKKKQVAALRGFDSVFDCVDRQDFS